VDKVKYFNITSGNIDFQYLDSYKYFHTKKGILVKN